MVPCALFVMFPADGLRWPEQAPDGIQRGGNVHVGVGVHAAGDGACFSACLYDGHSRPFLWLRDGTHPLAVGPVKPWPLIQARQIRPAAPVGARKPGARQIVSQDNPSGVSRIGGQAGPRLPTLRPYSVKIREAGPEALPTLSLPNRR